jgi:hypothetical protein
MALLFVSSHAANVQKKWRSLKNITTCKAGGFLSQIKSICQLPFALL